jgi:REP element-mobilizing transposase RayT
MPRTYFLRTLNDVTNRTRGYLPHWELPGATYSVTFRLHGSLPRGVVERLHDERRRIERSITGGVRPLTAIEEVDVRGRMEASYDDAMHTNVSVAHLNNPVLADLVAKALTHFDSQRYRLDAWATMPNHVHVVFTPFEPHTLPKILHSWKSYSATRANEILGQRGTFWHREYYDRIVRDDKDLAHTIEYVLANPGKARLKNWPWTSAGWKPA